jgi:hypothetical protein
MGTVFMRFKKTTMIATQGGLSVGLLFGDVLQEFNNKKKTGALFAVVDHNTDHMARLYFEDGEILHLSYGRMHGKEFLESLDKYDFGMAIFLAGMKAPRSAALDHPDTNTVIETIKSKGKTIRGIHFTQRGNDDPSGAS